MEPESPTSPPAPRAGASRGRPLDLGISIPTELLQDADAIRLAKDPKLSTEIEAASHPQAQLVAETLAEPVQKGGSGHVTWRMIIDTNGPTTLQALLEDLHLGSGAFQMNHFASALEDTVRTIYGDLDGEWFRGISEMTEKIKKITTACGMKIGKRRAYLSLACNQARTEREEGLWRRLCFGVLAFFELMVSMEAHMLTEALNSTWPFESSTILLYLDAEGVVRELPLTGSLMGQLPESHDVGLVTQGDLKFIQEVASRPVTISAFDVGLSSSETAVITLQAATLRALTDVHLKAFKSRTWELLNISNTIKLHNALLAAWDLMMAMVPTYTPLDLQYLLYETESTSGLHAAAWVANQATQVGWDPITGQTFCYHDAVSLAHALSASAGELKKVDTAQFDKFHMYYGWRYLKSQKARSTTHPKGKEVSADEKVRLLDEEHYWTTLQQWAAGLSRAKLCSFAMMGYIRKPDLDFQTCAPLLVIDACGQEWPLHALESLVRQSNDKLASRALFGTLLGTVEEDDVANYEKEHAMIDQCPLRRVSVSKYVIEFTRTTSSKWGNQTGRVAHCKMVCVIHLGNGYLPVVALLSPYFGGETGGNGKWSGKWSGRTDLDGGKAQIFRTLVHHMAIQGDNDLYNPRHYKLLNDWYKGLSVEYQASLWIDPGSQPVSTACPEVVTAGYTQIGGGNGIVDVADVRAMMWAS